jgi:hypothetical protein
MVHMGSIFPSSIHSPFKLKRITVYPTLLLKIPRNSGLKRA